ncbi:hypothetical protein [Micromonospora arida]
MPALQLSQRWRTMSVACCPHWVQASGYAYTCTVCAASVSSESCHPSTC